MNRTKFYKILDFLFLTRLYLEDYMELKDIIIESQVPMKVMKSR